MVQSVSHIPSSLETHKTILGNQTVPYTVRRSYRAKHARLEVRVESGLTVVVPSGYKTGDIPGLLRRKSGWILDKLARYGQVRSSDTERQARSGDSVPYLGRNLIHIPGNIRPNGRPRYCAEKGRFCC